jgi:hypothetical protein
MTINKQLPKKKMKKCWYKIWKNPLVSKAFNMAEYESEEDEK